MAADAQQHRWYLENTAKVCFFPKCIPKHRDFVVFPFSRTKEFENWWIKSGWVNVIRLESLPSKILICEEHFEKDLINRRYKVPRLALGALPTRNVECPTTKRKIPIKNPTNELFLHRVFCRLCGQMQAAKLDEDMSLLKQLDKIFHHQLQLSDSEMLPLGVCSTCKETANIIQTFWNECSEAQEKLKTIFNDDHLIDIPNPPQANDANQNSFDDSFMSFREEDDHMYLNKQDYSAECEEIEIDTTASQQLDEEHFGDEYVYESYCEELPNQSCITDACDQIEMTSDENQLIQENYAIEYVDESSSQELPTETFFTGKAESTDKGLEKKSSKQEAHICEVCGKTLKTLHRLRSHLNIHSTIREHQCNICGHKFKARRALMEHIESKHERKLFPCKICGVKYRWQKGLQRHMSSHKGMALKHSCKVCGKSFSVPHKLKHHMMLHTGDRIECDLCGKGYRFNYMLTQHKIRVHNMVIEGVKLYTTAKQRKNADRKK
ncbi:zinc finger protein 59-like [Anopheles nili]|uniref:zinc finger protein 59-like n=1 Tax=Anopheles nili TaxID=185578 RepID=UPI00237A0D26|nr:zinc finger protein 59-like [Anopheles nili]